MNDKDKDEKNNLEDEEDDEDDQDEGDDKADEDDETTTMTTTTQHFPAWTCIANPNCESVSQGCCLLQALSITAACFNRFLASRPHWLRTASCTPQGLHK